MVDSFIEGLKELLIRDLKSKTSSQHIASLSVNSGKLRTNLTTFCTTVLVQRLWLRTVLFLLLRHFLEVRESTLIRRKYGRSISLDRGRVFVKTIAVF